MVRAILEGRKTQTRRIMKPQPQFLTGSNRRVYADCDFKKAWEDISGTGQGSGFSDCPFGNPGDQLWVRETWRPKTHSFPTGWPYEYRATAEQDLTPTDGNWKPSIFMPRTACRITLEIVSVRVERLKDISESDAIAEGIELLDQGKHAESPLFQGLSWSELEGYRQYGKGSQWQENGRLVKQRYIHAGTCNGPISSYRSLWESINGENSWAQNPFVFVIEFKRL